MYRFFSDLDKPNMMDAKPFFEFNMLDFSESGVEELKRFTKSAFNVEETVKAAATLKYTRGMKQAIARQFSAPDDEFVRWLVKQVYSKPLTQQVKERFTVLAKQALREFVNDRIKATLKTALEEGEAEVESENSCRSYARRGPAEKDEWANAAFAVFGLGHSTRRRDSLYRWECCCQGRLGQYRHIRGAGIPNHPAYKTAERQ